MVLRPMYPCNTNDRVVRHDAIDQGSGEESECLYICGTFIRREGEVVQSKGLKEQVREETGRERVRQRMQGRGSLV
jgi:hypothetical protein